MTLAAFLTGLAMGLIFGAGIVFYFADKVISELESD